MISDKQKEELYRKFHSKVLGYLRSRISDPDAAEDLAAEVFLKVCEKSDSFDEKKASLSTWVYTIARNTLTDWFRARRIMEEIPESWVDGASVEEDVCRGEMLNALAEALETLDERERDILILRYYSGRTLKEIAAGMGISYAYIKVLQSKALARMKEMLGEQ